MLRVVLVFILAYFIFKLLQGLMSNKKQKAKTDIQSSNRKVSKDVGEIVEFEEIEDDVDTNN